MVNTFGLSEFFPPCRVRFPPPCIFPRTFWTLKVGFRGGGNVGGAIFSSPPPPPLPLPRQQKTFGGAFFFFFLGWGPFPPFCHFPSTLLAELGQRDYMLHCPESLSSFFRLFGWSSLRCLLSRPKLGGQWAVLPTRNHEFLSTTFLGLSPGD